MSHDILKRIEERLPELPSKQQAVALAILRDPLTASFQSVKELSEISGASQATIVRFAQTMTDGGYPELQAELQTHIHSLHSPLDRLGINLGVSSEYDDLLMRIYETQMNNLQQTVTGPLITSIQEAVEILFDANHVYTLGSRGTFAISYYLGHHLNRVLKNTDILPDDDRLADYICRIKPGDAAVIVNLPRYSDHLISAAKSVRKIGAKLIVVDSNPASPLSVYGDCCLYVSGNSNDFHNSMLSSMLVSEMLISLVVSRMPQAALENLNNLEPLFDDLHQFFPNK